MVELDGTAGDRKSQAETRAVFIVLLKSREECLRNSRFEPATLVFHFNNDLLFVPSSTHLDSPSGRSKLQRVLNDVRERRIKCLLVRLYHQRRLDLDLDGLSPELGFDLRSDENLVDDEEQIADLDVKLWREPKPDLSQRVVDEHAHPLQAVRQHLSRAAAQAYSSGGCQVQCKGRGKRSPVWRSARGYTGKSDGAV